MILFVLLTNLFTLQADNDCLEGVEKILVKHWGFYINTPADVRPEEFGMYSGLGMFIELYTDTVTINKYIKLLNNLKLRETTGGFDTRSKLELYSKKGVCYVYIDQFSVLMNGVEYEISPALHKELEELEFYPEL